MAPKKLVTKPKMSLRKSSLKDKGKEKEEKKEKKERGTKAAGGTDRLPPMDASALKEMVGYLKYHGIEKVKPNEDCAAALEKFHAATPEEKRKILASFKSPSGKSLKWAKEVVSSEKVTDQYVDSAESGMMTRPVGNKNVGSASLRGGGCKK
jgi:hypothetical protein